MHVNEPNELAVIHRLIVIPSQVEESRGVTFEVSSRDVSTSLDMTGYGNLRPPENGFAGVDAGCDFVAISAVTTRSPSFRPSTTSVTTPSLIPVLIWTGFGCAKDKT